MKKILLLFALQVSISSFAKIETDTINNWQLYKDNLLIFKSNEFEKINKTVLIDFNDSFKILKFNMFYDFYGNKTLKKMEFIVDNKIVTTFTIENDTRKSFIIRKEKIKNQIEKYKNKIIKLKYYDTIYSKGIIVCQLKFI